MRSNQSKRTKTLMLIRSLLLLLLISATSSATQELQQPQSLALTCADTATLDPSTLTCSPCPVNQSPQDSSSRSRCVCNPGFIVDVTVSRLLPVACAACPVSMVHFLSALWNQSRVHLALQNSALQSINQPISPFSNPPFSKTDLSKKSSITNVKFLRPLRSTRPSAYPVRPAHRQLQPAGPFARVRRASISVCLQRPNLFISRRTVWVF